MRVLLTGHKGFIGRHLERAMGDRGWSVTGIELAYPWLYDALNFFREDRITFDLAIHCAANVGGRASIDGAPLAVGTNLGLDSWYFRWLARTGTPRAVYYSSSAAYPVALQRPGPIHRLVETDIDPARPGQPDATYGLAKLTGELLVPYAEAEGTRVHVLRPFSGYGEDQADCYPFPAFIRRAREREDPFTIWGDGSSTRDWIHISDLVGATLAAIDQDVTGPVNLGWGRATSFDELATLVTREAGYRPRIAYEPTAPRGVHHRVCDPKRMLAFYDPKVSLEEGIRRALA
ncbi:NAD-dependent epimerase/dehydratase family protein [Streptomyces sp. NPDC096153]|uniref:NAD-dependent epimerase/dehydratase family protein n=1 Tax=Streptomyces sp. NPDC096153 TaxID=3155548 RepID=UPI003317B450